MTTTTVLHILLIAVGAILVLTGLVHLVRPERMASQLGWPRGGPFQQVAGVWNLAVGGICLASPFADDSFGVAAGIAAAGFWAGAALIHAAQLRQGAEQRHRASVPTAVVEALVSLVLAGTVLAVH